jgi:hypothetical protein
MIFCGNDHLSDSLAVSQSCDRKLPWVAWLFISKHENSG